MISLHGDDPLPYDLEQSGVPTVVGGTPLGGPHTPLLCVDADNVGGARQAVEHLVARGRRRIAAVTGPQDTQVGLDRLAGYRDALAAAGLSASLVEAGDFSEESGAVADPASRTHRRWTGRSPGIGERSAIPERSARSSAATGEA